MRTNIELDDKLITEAMAASGLKTKKATIEAALRTLIRRHRQDMAIAALAGAGWDGDLETMREGRSPDQRR
ncbi:Arc/MetJ family transcription regulator [Mesorhizobium robiniae]|uniref:Arc/MetJ family transcription regulator n=1 Tax=Mesorhizobium robiniae TaxID=559315 RepID=A0ABV2GY89_9HYPH